MTPAPKDTKKDEALKYSTLAERVEVGKSREGEPTQIAAWGVGPTTGRTDPLTILEEGTTRSGTGAHTDPARTHGRITLCLLQGSGGCHQRRTWLPSLVPVSSSNCAAMRTWSTSVDSLRPIVTCSSMSTTSTRPTLGHSNGMSNG